MNLRNVGSVWKWIQKEKQFTELSDESQRIEVDAEPKSLRTELSSEPKFIRSELGVGPQLVELPSPS
jgi:hypothetical protein